MPARPQGAAPPTGERPAPGAGGPGGTGGPGGRPPGGDHGPPGSPLAAADIQSGTAGGDTLTADGTHKALDGLAGNDLLTGTANADLVFGGDGNGSIQGLAADDRLFGGAGNDTLNGGAGNDTLGGGPGVDVMTGGAGADVFHGGHPGPATTTALSSVTDFVTGVDKLELGHEAATAANFLKTTAADAAAALTAANALFAAGTAEYVAVQVGANVLVFSEGHEGVAGDGIILTGVGLSGVAYTDFA